jgi:hypothetical protein
VKWGDGSNHFAHAQCLLWSPEVMLSLLLLLLLLLLLRLVTMMFRCI